MSESEDRALLARRLRTQGRACGEIGSPLYGDLMERAAADVEAGGVIRDVLAGHEADPGPSALALRLFGGLHRLALENRAPLLAAHLPSTGGDGDPAAAWAAVVATVREHFETVRDLTNRGVQTNEVGRSASLLGGFLLVAAETGLPLRVLELGASGGLNLRWDSYHYRCDGWSWGRPDSPVQLDGCFTGAPPAAPAEGAVVVAERRGCDAAPVDVTTEDGRLTLLSFVWPDQSRRLALLRGALEVATAVPVPVDRADAADWVQARLSVPAPGMATIVFHSVFWQYLAVSARDAILTALQEAGIRASADAPLYLLRMEPAHRTFEVRLTSWPGGRDQLLATCGAHGMDIHWGATDV
ncbi:MAG TPA: DUF2332 domain-containing protein [Thermoleophilia bacterium]|nr:DUF2332 domain-containing protein [Thermoleophilia bacterium]